MRTSPQHTAARAALKRQLLQASSDAPRRISMYRMFKSREFEELCLFYSEGIGIRSFAEFALYAQRLEETFEPPEGQEETAAPSFEET